MSAFIKHENASVRAVLKASIQAQHDAMRAWGIDPVRLLILYNTCAHRCFFCASKGTSDRPADDRTQWAAIREHLSPPLDDEQRRLIVAGNEPLLHPDFDKLMEHAKAQGFESIDLMTSGVQLGVQEDLERWISLNLSSVSVPIYGVSPDVHDAIVGDTAYLRLVDALDKAHARGVTVYVHTLALQRSQEELAPLAEMVSDRWGTTLGLAPVRDKEGQFSWASEALSLAVIDAWLQRHSDQVPIQLTGFPDCLGPDLPRMTNTAIGIYFRTQSTGYAEVCGGCQRRSTCPGVVQAQLDHFESQGLTPF